MCSRCAMSARDSPWRSRSAPSVAPRLAGSSRNGLSPASFTASTLLELARLGRVRKAAFELQEVALLGAVVLRGARDPRAQNQRIERRRAHDPHVAREVGLGLLV